MYKGAHKAQHTTTHQLLRLSLTAGRLLVVPSALTPPACLVFDPGAGGGDGAGAKNPKGSRKLLKYEVESGAAASAVLFDDFFSFFTPVLPLLVPPKPSESLMPESPKEKRVS